MNKKRLAGIEKQISRVISQVLFEEIKNPKINGLVSVTGCRVTPDLKFADISFSIMPTKSEEFDREKTVEGLEEVKRYFRKRIGEELNLRYTPEVRVKLDDTIEYGIKISKILNENK
jgi:ribosome-binding factor A